MRRLLLLLTLAITGCGPSYSFDLIQDDPHGADFRSDELTLYEGRAVALELLEGGDPVDGGEDVALHMVDGAVAGITRISTPKPHDFVVWGVGEGQTELQILVDGEVEHIVDVTVLPQD